MTHDARAVANALFDKSQDAERYLTPLQIIKLVYFCHGWMLGLYGRALISQPVEAWLYGPVVVDVYRNLRKYGGNFVTDRIKRGGNAEFDDDEADLINQVHSEYGPLSGIELSKLTHAPGTPWHEIWHQSGRNSIIPNGLIGRHYARIASSS